MLAISHPISSNGDEREGELGGFTEGFAGGDLLGDIIFDDLFGGFDGLLPDLAGDPSEILTKFSVGLEEEYGKTTAPALPGVGLDILWGNRYEVSLETDVMRDCSNHGNQEVMSVSKDESGESGTQSESSSLSEISEISRGRKPPAVQAKASHGKRKIKVDWTPELHRRFVQAVEQLGVDKAVPSRILELMGVDCLTRHNIASHLQKYRSRKKHLIAREAEAASWSQRRRSYYGNSAGRTVKRDINLHPWVAPTTGFPRPAPVPTLRPLHVWGHPISVEQSPVPVWPKHLVRSQAPSPPWVHQSPPPPSNPSYWNPHYPMLVPATLIQGAPLFPRLMPAVRFPATPLASVPPSPMYRPNCGIPPPGKHSSSQIQLEAHPPKESIDAAIGDVLSKPWLPLPLGLKPPSLESVMVELKRKGIPKIPLSYN